MFRRLIASLVALVSSVAWAASKDEPKAATWVDTPDAVVPYTVAAASDGTVLVAGYGGAGEQWTGRRNPAGEWSFRKGKAGVINSVVSAPNGEWLASGVTSDGKNGVAWFGRLSKDGQPITAQAYPTRLDSQFYAVAPAKDGAVLVGMQNVMQLSTLDAWIMGVRADGQKLWERTIEKVGMYHTLQDVISMGEGKWLGVGITIGTAATNEKRQGWALWFDDAGKTLMEKEFAAGGFLVVNSAAAYDDRSVVVLGRTGAKMGVAHLDGAVWVARVDAKGKKVWEKSIGKNFRQTTKVFVQNDKAIFAACEAPDEDGEFHSVIVVVDGKGKSRQVPVPADGSACVKAAAVGADGMLTFVGNAFDSSDKEFWIHQVPLKELTGK